MRVTLVALLVALGGAPLTAAAADQVDVTKTNIAVVRAEHDKLNQGDWQGAAELYAEDARNHGRPVGRAGLIRVLEDIYRTFPDFRMEIVDLVADGDAVVVRCKVSGTHEGVGRLPVNGGMLVGVAPTHKHFEVQHIHWYRLRDGKIIEHYATRDDLDMMRQLGLLPPIAAPSQASPK
jgi:predicted ester cyclase